MAPMHLLSLGAHGVANHVGPVGGPGRGEGRGLPAHLQDPRALATVNLHLLGGEGGSWGAERTSTSDVSLLTKQKHIGTLKLAGV